MYIKIISTFCLKRVDTFRGIKKQSGVELYADVHYEQKTLLLRTGRNTAPMCDLLRALAFCVGGTYRKVGPAFVLTNDIAGVGAQRQAILDFEELADAMRHSALHAAEKSLREDEALRKTEIPFLNDTILSPTAKQKENNTQFDDISGPGSSLTSVSVPFNQLTEAQKTLITDRLDLNDTKKYNLKKDIELNCSLVAYWEAPGGISMRTDLGAPLVSVFRKGAADRIRLKRKYLTADRAKLWAEQSKRFAKRGFLARPKSKEAVDSTLQQMRKLGLNQLWLVVFDDGKALIPSTPFPLLPTLKDQDDLMTYAIEAAKKINITVCPTLELFAWGQDTPQELRDRNILREDSEQIETRYDAIRKLRADDPNTLPAHPKHVVWVNPLDERVCKQLCDLMRVVSRYPGIGNVVCNSERPAGYIISKDYWSSCSRLLGYSEPLRFAFLQKEHIDPIDVNYAYSIPGNRANLRIAQYGWYDSEDSLFQDWGEFKEKNLTKKLTQLYAEAVATLPEKSRPSLLLMQGNKRRHEVWYDQWLDRETPMPKLCDDLDKLEKVPEPTPDKSKAGAPPKKPLSLVRLTLPSRIGPLKIDRKDWPAVLGAQLKDMSRNAAKTWDGFVLEEEDWFFEEL